MDDNYLDDIYLENEVYYNSISRKIEEIKNDEDRKRRNKSRALNIATAGVGGLIGAFTPMGIAGGVASQLSAMHAVKKMATIKALKDPEFRKRHPELVKKYRKRLIKKGIIAESMGYEINNIYDVYNL